MEEPIPKKKHILEVIGNEPGYLHRAAAEILQVHGVQEASTGRSRSKTRKIVDGKNGHLCSSGHFVETSIEATEVKVFIPHILKETCDFIRKQIQVEGIFRKSGSSSRKQAVMDRLISSIPNVPTEVPTFLPADTVFDVCSVMKQFLREMSQPLIPKDLHSLFVSCLGLSDKETVAESILLAVFLLPLQNIHVLCYLLQFLHEVAEHSSENQMGAKNLAVVIAPNIMPVEEKKLAKGLLQHYERIALDNHVKVVEILIENGELVGYINDKFEKVLGESLLDERESGHGRKKRRRSGSLTRVLGGIFWKGKSGKDCETPGDGPILEFKTPGNHTPIIMGVSGKRHNDFTSSTNRRKKNVIESMRNHGLTGPTGCATPNTFIACPSPLVCLDPSPFALNSNVKMSEREKRSPTVSEWRNFYTPELFGKRRAKRSPEHESNSSNDGKFKTKLLFGRKTGKKQALALLEEQTRNKLQKTAMTSSKISIHRLARSPRAGKLIRVQSRIPLPDSSPYSVRKESPRVSETDQGEYVTILDVEKITDEKNDAFISSPASESFECSAKVQMTNSSPVLGDLGVGTEDKDDVDGRVWPKLPQSASWEMVTTPDRMDIEMGNAVVENVELEFSKAVRESRIIELVSECKLSRKSFRGISFREKGVVSPSQKLISRSTRRKSHELPGTPVQTPAPRFMSLRSPRSRVTPPPMVARSPSRCTLQRGRPNSARAGLSRPNSAATTPATPVLPLPSSGRVRKKESMEMEMELENEETELINVILDRKGRIGRRSTCRPALPQVQSRAKLTHNANATVNTHSPRNRDTLTPTTKPQLAEKPSYMAGKLKLGPDTPGRAARSFSMRDDLITTTKASPMRSYLLARSRQNSGIPRYKLSNIAEKLKSPESQPRPDLFIIGTPMKRQLSVQEIVRRIETGQNQNENENRAPNKSSKRSPSKTSQLRRRSLISSSDVACLTIGPKTEYVNSRSLGRNPSVRANTNPVLKTINHD